MILQITKRITGTKTDVSFFFSLAYIAMAIVALRNYLPWSSVNFVLGICAIPVIIPKTKRQPSSRFAWFTALSGFICFLVPVQTFLYFTIISALLWAIESRHGKLPVLLFFNLVLISPIASYLISIFSFPIRLELTAIAGAAMNSFGLHTRVAGNTVSFNGNDYVVDPACMGLNMLLTALLTAIMMIAAFYRRTSKTTTVLQTGVILCMVLLFTIASNFFRIILLVYFDVRETAVLHELIGLACFGLYVLIPSFALTRFLVLKFGKPQVEAARQKQPDQKKNLVLQTGSFMLVACLCYYVNASQRNNYPPAAAPIVAGYTATTTTDGVTQYRNESALVYLKRIHGFYYTDHNPVICWMGSGYSFSSIVEKDLDGTRIFTGVLKKGNEKMHTAWWYDDGVTRTNSQLVWRWTSLKNRRDFSVVNVMANDKAELEKQVSKILRSHVFSKVLMIGNQ